MKPQLVEQDIFRACINAALRCAMIIETAVVNCGINNEVMKARRSYANNLGSSEIEAFREYSKTVFYFFCLKNLSFSFC